MTVFQLRADTFDGSTVPDEDNFLITRRDIEGSDYWVITDINGVAFTTIGAIPMRYLTKAMPGPNSYLVAASFAPGAGSTACILGAAVDVDDGLGGTLYAMGPTKTIDPAEELRITNMYFGADYFITIEADGAVGTAIFMDFGDIALQPIMSQVELGSSPAADPAADAAAENMAWAPVLLAGAGALSIGLWQRYDGSAGPYAITIPVGAEGDQFGVAEVVDDDGVITLTPSGGQLIENLAGTIAATAAISCPLMSILYKYDDGSSTWRILSRKIAQPVILAPAADAAAALTYNTGSAILQVTGAATVAISTTNATPGQIVSLWAKSVAGGGSYTLVVSGGTLTLNATDEGALVQRNTANTTWFVTQLFGGATIV